MPYQGYYQRKKEEKAKKEEPKVEEKTEFDDSLWDNSKGLQEAEKQPIQEETQKRGLRKFADEHVKLLTFLVCLALFLAFMGPFSVYRISEYVHKKEQDSKAFITMEYVYGLSQIKNDVEWSAFDDFKYETVAQTETFLAKDYHLADETYMIRVGGEISMEKPTYIMVINLDTGHKCDLLNPEHNLDDYLASENIKIGK